MPPFILQSAAKKLERRCAGTAIQHGLLGLMATRGPVLKALRYCPACVNRERSRFGEAYWHRSHQFPGVLICTEHKAWLEESEVVFTHPYHAPRFHCGRDSYPLQRH